MKPPPKASIENSDRQAQDDAGRASEPEPAADAVVGRRRRRRLDRVS